MSFGIVAAAGGAIVGGAMAAQGAKDAANTQANAAGAATASQRQMFNKQVELQQPWLNSGEGALNQLNYLLGVSSGPDKTYDQLREELKGQYFTGDGNGYEDIGLNAAINKRLNQQEQMRQLRASGMGQFHSFGMDDFEKDPGYDFRFNEGSKAVQSSLAARGGLFSGAAGKALTRYGQDFASNEYGKAFDRFNVNQTNQFNRLASLSGIGQMSANQTGAAASRFGEQMGSNLIGAGNAAAAGQVGSANAWNSAIGQGYNAYQNNELMKRLQAPVGGGYRYTVPSYEGAEY